jgi:hypothetical protein
LAGSRNTDRQEGTYWQESRHTWQEGTPGRYAYLAGRHIPGSQTGKQSGWQASMKVVTHCHAGHAGTLAGSREGRQTHTGRLASILTCR